MDEVHMGWIRNVLKGGRGMCLGDRSGVEAPGARLR